MRILIVEDEIKIRVGISRLITSHTQHTVVGEAKNGKEGLEMINRYHPQLVISDIRMPVMDGLEMLEEAVKQGHHCHFVILSGYSEFEYAQTALRYGVDDYLLKPLAPEDVTELLDKIQEKIDKEEARSVQTTEGMIREILTGGRKDMTDIFQELFENQVFIKDRPVFVAAGYTGNTSQKYSQALLGQWDKMKETYPQLHIFCVVLENTQEMFVLVQGEIEEKELEKKLNRRVYQNVSEKDQPVWTFVALNKLEEIQGAVERMRNYYLYGIRIGYREIITEEKVNGSAEEEFQYPIQLENRMQTAICKTAAERLREEADYFINYTKEMQCNPRYIRRTYKKMLTFMEHVCHEVNPEAYKMFQNQDLEKAASEMVTSGELEVVFRKAVEIIIESKDKKEDIRNYAIRRAINFIREHYNENISLDMLAERLEITPEYLSALFNKEVGINFSTFLKQFRISQAKRLLKGSDDKIYEIAQLVGYNDPKYFNRVFKDEVGMSPGDYRQKN